jgi:hypothetical protein
MIHRDLRIFFVEGIASGDDFIADAEDGVRCYVRLPEQVVFSRRGKNSQTLAGIL